jgi:hypothetical protein
MTAAALMVVLLIAFRLLGAVGDLPNFSPLPALLLCSVVFLPGRRAWLLPLGAWALTDPLVSLLQGHAPLGSHHASLLLGLAATFALATLLRKKPATWPMLGGAVAAALVFYLLTNTVSFLADPLYPKTATGFIQAQWTGPAGFGPTWLFLRNAVAANLLFTALFLAAHRSWLPAATPTAPVVAAPR